MLIKNNPVIINNSSERIYEFLNDFNNFENLMPEQINNWKSDKDSCSFEINNMATIELRIIKRDDNYLIIMGSEGKSPFPFQLSSHMETHGINETQFYFEIDAQVNPMLSMMVKKPLENLIEIMGQKLKSYMEN